MRAKEGKRLSSHIKDMDTLAIWQKSKGQESFKVELREMKLQLHCQILKEKKIIQFCHTEVLCESSSSSFI